MEYNNNQAEVQESKPKKKPDLCKHKRSVERLLEYNKTKNIEFINNWLFNSYTKTTENYLPIKSGYINFEDSNQIILHYINPRLTTFPRGFAQMVASSHDQFELEETD